LPFVRRSTGINRSGERASWSRLTAGRVLRSPLRARRRRALPLCAAARPMAHETGDMAECQLVLETQVAPAIIGKVGTLSPEPAAA
jgi:hypothetical protein